MLPSFHQLINERRRIIPFHGVAGAPWMMDSSEHDSGCARSEAATPERGAARLVCLRIAHLEPLAACPLLTARRDSMRLCVSHTHIVVTVLLSLAQGAKQPSHVRSAITNTARVLRCMHVHDVRVGARMGKVVDLSLSTVRESHHATCHLTNDWPLTETEHTPVRKPSHVTPTARTPARALCICAGRALARTRGRTGGVVEELDDRRPQNLRRGLLPTRGRNDAVERVGLADAADLMVPHERVDDKGSGEVAMPSTRRGVADHTRRCAAPRRSR